LTKKKDFRKGELLEKYMIKKLYKFKKNYLKKLKKELVKMEVSFFGGETLKKG